MAGKSDDQSASCGICKKTFSTVKYLHYHEKYKHTQQLGFQFFECDFCGMRYLLKTTLESHMKLSHENGEINRYECDYDGKTFLNKRDFLSHVWACHRDLKQCKVCEKSVKDVHKHMRVMHSARNFQVECEKCSKKFGNEIYLKIHMKTHEMAFQCLVCGKRFARKHQLKEHCKLHEDSYAYGCLTCCKKFSCKGALVTHMKTHDKSREKKFQCQHCAYSTDYKTHLTTHLHIHDANRAKDLTCKHCNYKTDRQGSFKLHMRTHNATRMLYSCPFCSHKATQRGHLDAHVKRKHNAHMPKEFKCDQCEYSSHFKYELKRHTSKNH